jgi:hypothetical protein
MVRHVPVAADEPTGKQRKRTFKGKTYVLRAKLNKFTISIVET